MHANRWIAVLLVAVATAAARAGDDAPALMDQGPAVCEQFLVAAADPGRASGKRAPRSAGGRHPDWFVPRGLAVDLGGAGILYDLDAMRCVATWDGGFLTWSPVRKDRYQEPAGAMQVTAFAQGPGWAKAGTWSDPRPAGWGRLPAGWARYRGRFQRGREVVIEAQVAGRRVLESPQRVRGGVARRFTVAAGADPLRLLVAHEALTAPRAVPDGLLARSPHGVVAAVVAAAPAGAALALDGDRLVLDIPAAAASFALVTGLFADEPAAAAAAATWRSLPAGDLGGLTHGGAQAWTEVASAGVLGTGAGCWAVDTLTLPSPNPWNAPLTCGGFDFFADGRRAAVCTWDGDVWIVGGIDATLARLTWRRYATGLSEPLGLRIVGEIVHVVDRNGITRIRDLDGDGTADHHEVFNMDNAPNVSGHAWLMCLETDPQGNFLYAMGAHRGAINPLGHHEAVARVSRDGARLEVIARGYRECNGLSVGPDGTIITTDNPKRAKESVPFDVIVPEAQVYGDRYYAAAGGKFPEGARTVAPVLMLPHDLDRSAGGQAWVVDGRWGMPPGTLVHTSYGHARLFLLLLDRPAPDARPSQAAAVQLPLSFASGIMRPRFNPADGQLYVCGLKGHDTNGVQPGCFQRVRATGAAVPWPQAFAVTRAGIRLRFGAPLDPAAAADAGRWSAKWRPLAEGEPEAPAAIAALRVDPGGRTVELVFAEPRTCSCIDITARLQLADGAPLPLRMAATINVIPER